MRRVLPLRVSLIPAPPRRRGPPTGRSARRRPRSASVRPGQPLDVVRQLVGGDLVAAQLAAEAGVEAEAAAQVHLEALDLVAVRAGHQLALEPDVGDLDPGAGVGAAVDVDGDRRCRGRRAGVSSSSTTRAACALVSTIASLQNSMPVQAITERRQASGRADRPSASAPATSESTWSPATSSTRIFCIGVVRSRVDPCASARSASLTRLLPLTRPATAEQPDEEPAVLLPVDPDVVARLGRGRRGRAVDQRALAGTRSPAPRGTSPAPQSATRNLIRARVRSRR